MAAQFLDTLASRRRRRRTLAALLMVSAVATVGAGAMSLALFTDSQAATGSWTSGTITLGSISPSTVFTATDILPGDGGSQTVTVSNSGTGALRYAMSSASTDEDTKGLAAQMTLLVEVGACPSAEATIYTGPLSDALFGSVITGADTGDRLISAGATETLCFTWGFPIASGNAFQDAATSTTFTFDAEQTTNN